jgi:hypothetical protein
MTDPTGTSGKLEGPASVELFFGYPFTPFTRKVTVTSTTGSKEYNVSPSLTGENTRLNLPVCPLSHCRKGAGDGSERDIDVQGPSGAGNRNQYRSEWLL